MTITVRGTFKVGDDDAKKNRPFVEVRIFPPRATWCGDYNNRPSVTVWALVDTGATNFNVKPSIIHSLGLVQHGTKDNEIGDGSKISCPAFMADICFSGPLQANASLNGNHFVENAEILTLATGTIDAIIGWNVLTCFEMWFERDTGLFELRAKHDATLI